MEAKHRDEPYRPPDALTLVGGKRRSSIQRAAFCEHQSAASAFGSLRHACHIAARDARSRTLLHWRDLFLPRSREKAFSLALLQHLRKLLPLPAAIAEQELIVNLALVKDLHVVFPREADAAM